THISLVDAKSGKNAFGDADDPQGITDLCRSFIAGQLRYAKAVDALIAPTVNCHRRRRRHTFSPTNISWGLEDRSALLRVKGGALESTHTENRDRKSTRLNSSHEWISYAVFCLKKKNKYIKKKTREH